MWRRSRRAALTIDMAPLIDVVFLLLVFFMLTSGFVPPSLPLRLPQASGEPPGGSVAVVVSMDAGGAISVNGQRVEKEAFGEVLREALRSAATPAVHFRGDKEADYGAFIELMDLSRNAGASQFHLVYEPKRAP